jgi:polyisoprenoid-binding protein YceI
MGQIVATVSGAQSGGEKEGKYLLQQVTLLGHPVFGKEIRTPDRGHKFDPPQRVPGLSTSKAANSILQPIERKVCMKNFAILAGIVALAAPFSMAQTSTWTSDPAHSEVDFSILHMSVSKVHGRFGLVAATIAYNQADVTKSTVTATIGVSTLDTGEPRRDQDVKGAGFFDAANFPGATFTSTQVSKNGDHLTVNGDLTLHGVSRPVVLDVEGPTGPVTGMDHKPHAGFSATTTISRLAYNIGTKVPAAVVGDDVKLEIELEVVKQ